MELAGFPKGWRPPEGRDLIELLDAWGGGERTRETWLAFAGFLYVVFVVALIAFGVAAGVS